MGTEYARWLVPTVSVRPTPEQIAHLVWALVEAEYLPRDDERARFLRGSILTRDGLAVIVKKPATRERPAHRVFRLGPLAPTAEHIAALPKPISFRWPIDGRPTSANRVGYLRYPLATVPEYDEVDYSIELVVAESLSSLEDDYYFPDDVTEPFFITVDCGKSFARVEEQTFAPAFRALVERVFGVPFREVEQYY